MKTSMTMDELSPLLRSYYGIYVGEGINHEGEKFKAEFTIFPLVGANSFSIEFRAEGMQGELFHEEKTVLASSTSDIPTLYVVSTNHPALFPHELQRMTFSEEGSEFIFAFNKAEDSQVFREEVTLSLNHKGKIGYKYAWAPPGGIFQERSSVLMEKKFSEQNFH